MDNLTTTEKKCAFVVEDDDALRKLYTYLLQGEAFEVKACANIASFNHNLKVNRPSIIIMDLSLPDGNGLDLCRQLKENPETAKIPIIILSGHSELARVTKGCKAEAVLTKPFDLDDFLARITSMVTNDIAN